MRVQIFEAKLKCLFFFSSEIVLMFLFSLVYKRPKQQRRGDRCKRHPASVSTGAYVCPGRLQEGETPEKRQFAVEPFKPSSNSCDCNQHQRLVCSSGIFVQIWRMALCVTCVFAITLSVFPVITVRVRTVYTDDVAWGQFNF